MGSARDQAGALGGPARVSLTRSDYGRHSQPISALAAAAVPPPEETVSRIPMRLPAAMVAVVAPELQVVAALVTVHVRMTVLVPPGPVTRSNALVFVPPGAAVMRTDRFSAVQAVL